MPNIGDERASAAAEAAAMERLFGRSGLYLGIIDDIVPRLVAHRYQFRSKLAFQQWIDTSEPTGGEINRAVALEMLDNAHFAATTALIRTAQWAEAMGVAYARGNYLAWSAAARGLVESSGDIGDGLLNVPGYLAQHHAAISHAISGRPTTTLIGWGQVEDYLAQFIRAKWTRDKSGEVPRAKENVAYVRWIERANIEGVVPLYHRLCGIAHPASGSIDYMYTQDSEGVRVDAGRGKVAIDEICQAYPNVFAHCVMLACNGALLILRVLHKFDKHPKLPELRKFDWNQIKMWPEIEQMLRR